MMKLKIYLISLCFFTVNLSFAEWKKLDCVPDKNDPTKKQMYLNVHKPESIEHKYLIDLKFLHENNFNHCEFTIYPATVTKYPDGGVSRQKLYPRIIFNKEGQVKFRTQRGIKTFSMIPKSRNSEVYIDEISGDIKVINTNGSELFFDGKTGKISKDKTTDFEVDDSGVLKLNKPKFPMITFPYAIGNDTSNNPDISPYLEHEGRSCKFKAKSLYEYEIKCDGGSYCKKSLEGARAYLSKQYQEEYLPGYDIYYADILIEREAQKNRGEKPSPIAPKMKEASFVSQGLDRAVFKSINQGENLKELSSFPGCENVIQTSKLASAGSPKPKIAQVTIPKAMILSAPPRTSLSKSQIRPISVLKTKEKVEKESGEVEQVDASAALKTFKAQKNKIDYCLSKINDYFESIHGEKELDDYVRLQSNIALNRIAWTSMKINQEDTGNIEENILDLLKKRNPTLHQSFLKKSLKTRNQKLLAAMADLKKASKEFSNQKNSPFQIKYGDIKILDILVELEKDPDFGRSAATGARDFTSIIRNSMKPRLNRKAANIEKFESTLSKLMQQKGQIEANIVSYLAQNGCSQESDFLGCGDKTKTIDFDELINEHKNIMDNFYAKLFERNVEIKNNFLWRSKDKDYWLKVK